MPQDLFQLIALDSQEQEQTACIITYTGEQTKPIPSILIFNKGFMPEVSNFSPLRNDHLDYTNDEISCDQFELESGDMQIIAEQCVRILDTQKSLIGSDFLSVRLLAKRTTTSGNIVIVREFIVNNRDVGHEFFECLSSIGLNDATPLDSSTGRERNLKTTVEDHIKMLF